jgi:hypothetical protein
MSFSVSIALPVTATLTSPSGSISSTTPTFRWDEAPGAMWYNLWVNDSTGSKINQWYRNEEAGCPPGIGPCTVSPSVELSPGSGQWWVRTYNSAGYGDWSSGMSFSVGVSSPGQATLLSPSGSITDTTPPYEWDAVAGATWYHLYVNDSTGNKINQWYSAMDLHCPRSPALCRVTLGTVLASGNGQWWVQTYNSAGSGDWSSGMLFTVSP